MPAGSWPLTRAQVYGAAPPLRKKFSARAWPTVPGNRVDPLAGSTTVSDWSGSTVIWYCWYRGWVWVSVPFTVKLELPCWVAVPLDLPQVGC